MTNEIIPAILTDTLEDLEDKIELVEPFFDTVQIDYVDGYFAPQLSCCEAPQIATLDTPISLEVQLMIESPDLNVEEWLKVGADRLVGHIEKMGSQRSFVQTVSNAGLEVGLGLNIETDLSELNKALIDSLDVVLLMAHEVGVGGKIFDPAVLDKVQLLRGIHPKLNIEVDGGVNLENAQELFDAGANILAVGSAIFEAKHPEEVMEEFRKMVG